MTGPTHVAGGILAASLLIPTLDTSEPTAVLVTVAALGALLPDIDLPGSLVSKMLGPIAMLYNWIEAKVMPAGMQHRGFTHTLLCLCLMAVWVLWGSDPERDVWVVNYYALMLTAGVASHIALDMLTVSGVPLLWPLLGKFRFRVGFIHTGSAVEEAIHNLIWAVIVVDTLI